MIQIKNCEHCYRPLYRKDELSVENDVLGKDDVSVEDDVLCECADRMSQAFRFFEQTATEQDINLIEYLDMPLTFSLYPTEQETAVKTIHSLIESLDIVLSPSFFPYCPDCKKPLYGDKQCCCPKKLDQIITFFEQEAKKQRVKLVSIINYAQTDWANKILSNFARCTDSKLVDKYKEITTYFQDKTPKKTKTKPKPPEEWKHGKCDDCQKPIWGNIAEELLCSCPDKVDKALNRVAVQRKKHNIFGGQVFGSAETSLESIIMIWDIEFCDENMKASIKGHMDFIRKRKAKNKQLLILLDALKQLANSKSNTAEMAPTNQADQPKS